MSDILRQAKELVENGEPERALSLLEDRLGPSADFALLARVMRWAGRVDWPGRRRLRLAVAGGGTLDHFTDFLRLRLLLNGFELELYTAPYDTWRMEILNEQSGLHRFKPDLVWIFTHWRDIRLKSPGGPEDAAAADQAWRAALAELSSYWGLLKSRLPGVQVIQNNVDPVPEQIWGNFEALLPGSRTGLRRAFNFHLGPEAAAAGVLVFDLEQAAMTEGLEQWHDHPYWFHSKHPFAPRLADRAAARAARFLAAIRGGARKAVVVDLDNTLWGGVVGDEGVEGLRLGHGPEGEAFTAFQRYLKGLADRGVILAVSSKNEEAAAKAPFLERRDMVLKLEDFAIFKANWRNKADNLREIARTLNIGLDALVFVDDNPAERALVRAELPQVAVPEMPADPAGYIQALDERRYFECVAVSREDRDRGRMYRENARRDEARIQAANLDDHLAGLEMTADRGPADVKTLPRMAQLVNKSNQFHPTTTRYTEEELRALAGDGRNIVRWFALADRFGDHGLVSVVILKPEGRDLIVDTWAMSCRVLERGLEEFILRDLVREAEAAGAEALIGRYRPTPKNALVAELYPKLGFLEVGRDADETKVFRLSLPPQTARPEVFINKL